MVFQNVRDIEKVAAQSNLLNYLAGMEDFLKIIADEGKMRDLIKSLKVKFTNINIQDAPATLANFVVDGNYYQLNEIMAARVLQFKEVYIEKEYSGRNYSFIKTKAPKDFVTYVDQNLDGYIANIWLPLAEQEDNKEEEKYLLELLNNIIDDDYLAAVIEKTHTRITELAMIDTHDINRKLLVANKVEASWENVIHYLDENSDEFDEILIAFVSDEENAQALKKNKLNTEESHKEAAQKIAKAVISQQEIPDGAYEEIMGGIPYYYNDLNFVDHLSMEKVKILLSKGKFGVSVANFERLKKKSGDLHILLLERAPAKAVSELASFNIDDQDALAILNSPKFNSAQKNTVVEHLSLETIKSNPTLGIKIGMLIILEGDFKVDHEIVAYIIGAVKVEVALPLLNKYFGSFSVEETEAFIRSWPYPYKEITVKGKRPWLTGGPLHSQFVKNLLKAKMISKAKEEKGGIRISTFLK